jgi:ABC-type branched-subunit amino acid transport system ATPase component
MTAAPVLEVHGLTAGYDGTTIIRNVGLTVRAGEVVALLGPNGAGKTTTMRAISGTIRPTAGTVTFLGRDTARSSPQALARRGLVHVPEGRGIFHSLTVNEHLRIVRGARGGDIARALGIFPALAELRERKAGLLSGGEQQMLALACALARRPRLLLADELSLGLAPVIVEALLPRIREFADESDAGVLLVEQHARIALDIADRVYSLSHGDVVLAEAAGRLRHNRGLLAATYLGEPLTAADGGGAGNENTRQ